MAVFAVAAGLAVLGGVHETAWAQEADAAVETESSDAGESVEATEEEEAAGTPFADLPVEEQIAILAASSLQIDGDTGEVAAGSIYSETDVLWTCLAAFLVFFMQAGFAMVEAGFTRAKNICNIMMKNLLDFSIGSLTFWLVGFGLMFGAPQFGGLVGGSDFLFEAQDPFGWAFLIFQTVFCATAATIVSGAMAERTKFVGYLCYSIAITAIVYPVFGSWAWNGLWSDGGWLEGRGFLDFAGSTVVHSIGAWCALAGAIVLGPRIGKYVNGKSMPIPGHNLGMGALGVFILWLGWFGFNPGSTTAVGGGSFAYIAVTTNIAAACGAIGAMVTSWVMFKKPDTSFALNGALAGLVTITAGCDIMSVPFAALSGLIGGVIVVFSCMFFDRIRVDDPVGAISVHGVCGAWGTLAIGLWGTDVGLFLGHGATQLGVQALGVAAAFLWAFPTSFAIFMTIKLTVGLRVSEEEEREGLDISEHGMLGYPPSFVAELTPGSPVAAASQMVGSGSAVAVPKPGSA